MREGGVAGAEVVDRHARAELLDRVQAPCGVLGVAHQRRLCDLQRQRPRRQPAARERLAHVADELVGLQLARGHVHRDAHRAAVRAPAGALAARLLQHPPADVDDQPRLLQQRDEVVGLHEAARTAVPADQRLDARGRHPLQVERRLVEQEELVALERAAQLHLQLHAALHAVVHARLEHHVAVLAVPLGAVHRDVGVAQEVIDARALAGGHADARGHRQPRVLAAREHERRSQRLAQAAGDQLRVGELRDLFGEHHELVAADAPERVAVAHDLIEPRGDRLQQLVADRVSERVVDRGEVVEVDHQRGDRRAQPLGAGQHLLAAVEDQRTVGQARQLVVRRHERQLLLAARQLAGDARALLLEGLAHAHERHVDRSLHHRRGLRERGGRDRLLARPLLQELDDRVAPVQAALGHLVQRRRVLRRQLTVRDPRFASRLAPVARIAACHPHRHRLRRAAADALEAVHDRRVERRAGSLRGAVHARPRAAHHLLDIGAERLAKSSNLVLVASCLGRLEFCRCAHHPSRGVS